MAKRDKIRSCITQSELACRSWQGTVETAGTELPQHVEIAIRDAHIKSLEAAIMLVDLLLQEGCDANG